MRVINYISIVAVPASILIILLYGFFERKNVFEIFLKGANDGLKMVIKIFPTLIGLFLAIGALSSSGILEFIIKSMNPFLNILNIPPEIMPLAILRPISGSRIYSNCNRDNAKGWSRFIYRINCCDNYGIY